MSPANRLEPHLTYERVQHMADDLPVVGDVVQLKSGGPRMTYNKPAPSGFQGKSSGVSAICLWFDGSDLKEGEFALSSLIKFVSPPTFGGFAFEENVAAGDEPQGRNDASGY